MNLLASTLWGGLYLVILFGLCLAFGIFVRLMRLRAAAKKQKSEQKSAPALSEKKEEPKKPEEKKEQRVYYIVEKKRVKKPQTQYFEPKKIRFE